MANISILLKVNWIKTLYFNFRYLPLNQAVKLPIILFYNVKTFCKKGNIIFNCPIKLGMVRIGHVSVPWQSSSRRSNYLIRGRHFIHGDFAVGAGSIIEVKKDAVFETGNNVWIHENVRIFCYESVTIKNNAWCAWNSLITDTNFHHYINNGKIQKRTEPVVIQENCWLGNSVSINKGTNIPKNAIVASNSLVNKDFSNYCNIILAGIPARIVSENCQSIGGKDIIKYDSRINQYMTKYNLTSINVDDIDFLEEVDIRQYINSNYNISES